MNNYQLYRTNLLLGGQMKWDLVIDSTQDTLYVSDFHLTPISNNTPYTYKTDEYLIKNNHEDNIKTYYKENKDNFYKEYLDTEFSHNWPIVCKENEVINAYSNIYDMGCKRTKHYSQYYKQFEFFCPLWLEHITDTIKFKINVKNIETNNIIGSNVLKLSIEDVNNKYHKKFIEYFNNYITNAGLDKGSDDVLNIKFNKNTATITGFNASKGIFETLYIDNIINNIISIERPLMEFDNMLISSFVNNTILCKQLFNFNLCFNLADIFSENIIQMIYGENVLVTIDVYMGENELEKRDFYTEYEYISKYVKSDDPEFTSDNVLNYLKDNEYIEFIDKNKFCQSICHWSLYDNNDYIFNLYDGFSGLIIKGDKYYLNEHLYRDTPNTYIKKYDLCKNTAGWLNVYDITEWDNFYKYIKYTKIYKLDGTYIAKDASKFIHNMKYKTMPIIDNNDKCIYILGLNVTDDIIVLIENTFNDMVKIDVSNNGTLYMLCKDNLVMLITNDMNLLTFKSFTSKINTPNFINNIKDSTYQKYLQNIQQLLNSKIEPSTIIINSTLAYYYTNGPSNVLSEVEYITNTDDINYVLRYDGKLKPTFIKDDIKNTLYYKDYVSNNENDSKLVKSDYTKFNNINYEPIYPSINFCAIKKLNNWSYNACPNIKVTEHDNIRIYQNKYEYSWFNDSRVLNLDSEIHFSVINVNNKDEYETLDNIIINELSKYYKTNDMSLISYIKSLYEYTNNWEYLSNSNVNDYMYNISLKLKN